MKRIKTEINSGSMADIAFLLLVFFLVATTIDIDSGIARKLPPFDTESKPPIIKERNILNVKINSKNEIMINKEICKLTDLRKKTINFLQNKQNDKHKPVIEKKSFSLIGTVEVSQGIISLQNDRGTSYNTYINVLNELTAACNILRNELSIKKFNKQFSDLSKVKQKIIYKARPCVISEAEPVFMNND